MLVELVARRWMDRGKSADRFDAIVGGEVLVTSRGPIYATARVLLERREDSSTVLEFRHRGSEIVAARGTVGELAKWTVSEGKTGLKLERWEAFPQNASSRRGEDA